MLLELLSSLLYLARFRKSALFQYLILILTSSSSGTSTRLFLAPWTSSLARLPEPGAICLCVLSRDSGIATELHETTREPSPPLRDASWRIA